LADLPEVTASVLKNKFGQVASLATTAPLAVSRHHRREFVLLTAQQYEQLQQSRRAPLEALTAEFDQLVTKLNTPKARRAADSLFAARGPALGRAALKARRTVDA
jgi:PHD/YefM family antitoxin component YafN of YafNO toxin-antitoxin module